LQIQKSYSDKNSTLYLVATPIGNLSDMTPRAVETLKSVAMIASEDTRHTKKLCTHFEIETALTSYHEHNKHEKASYILDILASGRNVALVSDAGMPLISDPGDKLVELALEQDFAIVPIPGANAALTALIASGLTTQPFLFYGFLQNRTKSKKKIEIEKLTHCQHTMIFYESPHRTRETLTMMLEIFGDRKATIARELTKKYEEFTRGNMSEIVDELEEIKGEIVLIVEGSNLEETGDNSWWQDLDIATHVETYIGQNLSPKESIKKVAKDRGVPKQEVYKIYHNQN